MVHAGYPQRQAVAASLSNARRHPNRASGGIGGGGIGLGASGFHPLPTPAASKGAGHLLSPSQGTPWWTRAEARHIDDPVKIKFKSGGGIGGEHMAEGGMMSASEASPWWERQDSKIIDQPFHGGLIPGAGAGRTDRRPLSVGSDSHVIPSFAVNGLGQGSTENGSAAWAAAIRGAPWGVPIPPKIHGKGPPAPPHPASITTSDNSGFASGGADHETSILAADGEVIVPPEDVLALGERGVRAGMARRGESAMDLGHRLIDEAIERVRIYNIKWLETAPKPKK